MTTTRSITVVAALGAVLATSAQADAEHSRRRAKRAKPACGLSYLPFVEGATWTYEYLEPEDAAAQRRGISQDPPPKITIRVVSVESRDDKTIIGLEESYRDVTIKTALSCSKKSGMMVSPQSFFFAAEIGGALNVELADLKEEGLSYPDEKGFRRGEQLFEALKANFTRTPSEGTDVKLAGGKLEVERQLVIGATEAIETDLGSHKAVRVDVTLTARAALEPELDKPFDMPAARSVLWLAPEVGVVKAENRFGQGWVLAEHSVAE